MHFGNPQFLWLLVAWPLLALLGWRALGRRRRLAERIGDPGQLARLYPESIHRWRRRRLMLALLAVLLLIFTAARPQYGRVEQTVRSAGVNVLVALDCSRSMEAGDVPPNRLTRAKQSLTYLIRRLQGNRVGIIAFSGAALLNCPMTLDQRMAVMILESLDPGVIGSPGTDIGGAIRTAIDAFERGATEGGRALVLVTDGEDHEGTAEAAATEAAEKGIRIYGLGIGTTRGAPLMDEEGGFKEDAAGAKVNTRLEFATLKRIAELTGGEALEAGDKPESQIAVIARMIEQQQQAQWEEKKEVLHQDRFQWFLAPALGLLLWLIVSRPESNRLAAGAVTPSTTVRVTPSSRPASST